MDTGKIYDKIYRYVFSRVHNRETSEDITQETFLRYISRYGQDKNYNMKLMYTIAKNLCVDEFRRGEYDFPGEYYERSSNCHRDEILEKMIVDEALNSLTGEEKDILLLRYVNNESVSTISNIYGCSRFSMYRRIKKALGNFRDQMEVNNRDE